jgi:hypothetical protein
MRLSSSGAETPSGDICVTAPATSFIDSSQRNLLVTLTNNRRVEAEVVPLDNDG